MGCLKLSYYEIESCLPEASPLRISYVNGEVREEKEHRFLGVVNQQTNGGGPTWDKGAFVSADDFYGFMQDQARGNPVEVAAFALKKGNEEIKYFVLPWKGNTGKFSYSHLNEVAAYVPGYSLADVISSIHTHPFGSEPSGGDKKVSDAFKIPVYTIGPKGEDYIYFNGITKKYSGD